MKKEDQFLFLDVNIDALDEGQNKIEVVNCPRLEKKCEKHLSVINEYYSLYFEYHLGNEYQRAIKTLDDAYNKTFDLRDSSCIKCSEFFRLTITQSLENLHDELKTLSTGLFGKKRYKPSFLMVESVLANFENKNLIPSYSDNFLTNKQIALETVISAKLPTIGKNLRATS